MKKLFLLLFLAAPSVVRADLTHTIQSSASITIAAPGSTVTRQGNSYSISGSGVDVAVGDDTNELGGLGAVTNGVNAFSAVTASQSTEGEDFTFSMSHTAGDTTTNSITVGTIPAYSNVTSTSVGSAGTGAIAVGRDGALTLTPGTATGTTITGQHTTTLFVD